MSYRYPAIRRLEAALARGHRIFRDAVKRAHGEFGDTWADELEQLVARMFPDDSMLSLAVQGYSAFALDAMRRQSRFDRERQYLPKSFDEAATEVYQNASYMTGQYLPGLLLSHYLWVHHYRQLRYFRDAFVGPMSRTPGAFAEVGIGTGVYSRTVLTSIPEVRGIGFDISPSSKEFAEAHLACFDVLDRYAVELRNVVDDPPREPLEWVLCIEVLEHLEDPQLLLRALRPILAPGGKAFITAAINAANADHIYLYRTAEEVAAQIRDSGFAIEQYFAGNAYTPTFENQPIPAVAAFVVTPREVQ